MPLGTIFYIISIALSKSIQSASDPSNPLPKTELHLCFIYSVQISSIHPLPKHKSQGRSLKTQGHVATTGHFL